MTPLHFGPAGQRLFGLLHAAEAGAPRRGAVLLARPFGHEAIRTHRLYRVLAERLARQGWDVLRYDHPATGDSAGDDDEVRLADWCGGLWLAHRELELRARQPVRHWVAARLGATAALLAAAKANAAGSAAAPALVLWDPVIDGAAYLQSLRVKHVEALEASFSLADRGWRAQLAQPDGFLDEAIGFAIAPALRAEVLAVRADGLRAPSASPATLVHSPSAKALAAWAAAPGHALRVRALEKDFDWTSDDSLNTALVPSDAMAALLGAVDDA